MNHHTEAPRTGLERLLCVAGIAAALGTGAWLTGPLFTDLDGRHTVRFVALSFLLALTLYLIWVLAALLTVRYTLDGDVLVLRQGLWGRAEIPLGPDTHLYRWRRRWAWSGGADSDLGVEAIALFPPGPVLNGQAVWVARFRGPKGKNRAVGFRPSAVLLAEIRTRMAEHDALAG
ncbi:MAG TPA: hypothetical protein VD902_02850 [Symbiobacteriaceae bacterium]|nr:hypothetical protein [Symbiobacteriaceae bacterium]